MTGLKEKEKEGTTASTASVGVGERLRYARLAKKLTLEQAEADTNIRARYLAAVEEERYQDTPGDVFVRGIIRTYGNYLGLDGPTLVSAYRQAHSGGPAGGGAIREVDKVKVKVQLKDQRDVGSGQDPAVKSKGRGLPLRQVGCGLFILLLLGAACFFMPNILAWLRSLPQAAEKPASPITVIQQEKPAKEAEAAKPEAAPAAKPATEAAKGQQPEQPQAKDAPATAPASPSATLAQAQAAPGEAGQEVVVKLNFLDRCWLAVYADEAKVYEGLLTQGAVRTFTAKQALEIRYGNIAAVEVEVNGQKVPNQGEKGVADKVYTR